MQRHFPAPIALQALRIAHTLQKRGEEGGRALPILMQPKVERHYWAIEFSSPKADWGWHVAGKSWGKSCCGGGGEGSSQTTWWKYFIGGMLALFGQVGKLQVFGSASQKVHAQQFVFVCGWVRNGFLDCFQEIFSAKIWMHFNCYSKF